MRPAPPARWPPLLRTQRSAEAAKDIKGLIGHSVDTVGEGAELVQRVCGIVADIANAGLDQQSGIDQVNQSIGQMESVTQQNAVMVGEASSAARSLQEQALALAKAVRVFKVREDAGGGAGKVLAETAQ